MHTTTVSLFIIIELIDITIRYAMFAIIGSVWIMIANALWFTNEVSGMRYVDNVFLVLSLLSMLTVCNSCYKYFCTDSHLNMRTKYIDHFYDDKERVLIRELKEKLNNPKQVKEKIEKKLLQMLDLDAVEMMQSRKGSGQTTPVPFSPISPRSPISPKSPESGGSRIPNMAGGGNASGGFGVSLGINFDELGTIPDKSRPTSGRYSRPISSRLRPLTARSTGGLRSRTGSRPGTRPGTPRSTGGRDRRQLIAEFEKEERRQIKREARLIEDQVHRQLQELELRLVTYIDEETIALPTKSPTLFPGAAFRFTSVEAKDIKRRKERFLRDEDLSESDNFSDVQKKDDPMIEINWPQPSRTYGQIENMYEMNRTLKKTNVQDLGKLWKFFDKDHKHYVDYREGLVKLLGALWLLYFKKTQKRKKEELRDEEMKIKLLNKEEETRAKEMEISLVLEGTPVPPTTQALKGENSSNIEEENELKQSEISDFDDEDDDEPVMLYKHSKRLTVRQSKVDITSFANDLLSSNDDEDEYDDDQPIMLHKHSKRLTVRSSKVDLTSFADGLLSDEEEYPNQSESESNSDEIYHGHHIGVDEIPPKWKEIRPLMQLMAKYIRDDLRQTNRRYMKRNDFIRNITKYIGTAVDKREMFLKRRWKKLHGHSSGEDSDIRTQSSYESKERDSLDVDSDSSLEDFVEAALAMGVDLDEMMNAESEAELIRLDGRKSTLKRKKISIKIDARDSPRDSRNSHRGSGIRVLDSEAAGDEIKRRMESYQYRNTKSNYIVEEEESSFDIHDDVLNIAAELAGMETDENEDTRRSSFANDVHMDALDFALQLATTTTDMEDMAGSSNSSDSESGEQPQPAPLPDIEKQHATSNESTIVHGSAVLPIKKGLFVDLSDIVVNNDNTSDGNQTGTSLDDLLDDELFAHVVNINTQPTMHMDVHELDLEENENKAAHSHENETVIVLNESNDTLDVGGHHEKYSTDNLDLDQIMNEAMDYIDASSEDGHEDNVLLNVGVEHQDMPSMDAMELAMDVMENMESMDGESD